MKTAFSIKEAELFSGGIRFESSTTSIIGVGAFKTAQLAQLMLSPLRQSGIGSLSNHDIVLKGPYIEQVSSPELPFNRYILKDESSMLYREVNVLYWAKALLKMSYDFIDCAINNASAPPPFDIPRLHFIDAGLVLAYSSSVTVIASNTDRMAQPVKPGGSAVNSMYLAEEFIPTPLGKGFKKYIHNGNAVPCDLFDTEADKTAEFLAFTQHVQYAKTNGQVYISDYQGMLSFGRLSL